MFLYRLADSLIPSIKMNEINKYLKVLAVSGNLLFILWILYNGINESFAGTLPEKISYIVLIGLLAVNSFLLFSKEKE
jgi:hypothetical protein